MATRIFLTILSVFICLSGSAKEISQHIDFSNEELNLSTFTEGDSNYTEIKWDSMVSEDIPGRYDIPVKFISIQVPTYSNNFNVSVSDIQWDAKIDLENPLRTVTENTSGTSKTTDAVFTEAVNHEELDTTYLEIVNEYFLNARDHYVLVKIRPIHTINSKCIKPIKSVTFEVSYQECTSKELPVDLERITNENHEATYKMGLQLPSSTDKLDQYIIITTTDLVNACKDLALWKAQKGLITKIFTLEEILSRKEFSIGANGIFDEASAIRRFLQSNCDSSKDNYCLFIGSSDRIPLRYFYDKEPSNRINKSDNLLYLDNFIPSDVYFSDLISDWNPILDPVGKYTISASSIHYSPCIYVGRLICNNSTEVANYIHKLIYYEANPGKGDNDYLSKGLVTKQRQHRTYPDLVTQLGSLSEITRLVDNNGTTFESNRPQGCDVIEAMKQVGIMSLQGHGVAGSIACAGQNGEDNMPTWRYIKALDSYPTTLVYDAMYKFRDEPNSGLDLLNNIYKPSILYTLSCDVMPFDRCEHVKVPYNMGTAFTVAGLFGGVAMLGNTRTGWDGSNRNLELKFATEILNQRHIGKAYSIAKAKASLSGYACASHNLMGDPEFSMWIHKPFLQDMNCYVTDGSIILQGSTVPNTNLVLYDGVNSPVKFSPTSNSFEFAFQDMKIQKTFFSTGVWKEGYLPYIRIAEQNAILSNMSKSFIVNDANFGKDIISGKTQGDCVIGNNGTLKITAINSIKLSDGFIIAEGGRANFRCLENIFIDGSVIDNEGTLNMNGDTVTIEELNVKSGGEMQINHNSTTINPFSYEGE